MFYRLNKGKQKELLQRAIAKAGSERKLAKLTGISKGSIYSLKFEKRNLSEIYSKKILAFLGLNENYLEKYIIGALSDNWGRKKGGINLIKIKREKGILNQTIENLKKASSKRMKEWHKYMRENEPKKYYIWQYERFKKVGTGYTFNLQNGIKVRNKLEKEVGNILIKYFPKIKYEPYLNINGKAYFPDFLAENQIIEVTEWKHPSKEKINYLKKKIKDYKNAGYRVFFFIPKKYRKFYKELEGYIISDLSELHKFIMPL